MEVTSREAMLRVFLAVSNHLLAQGRKSRNTVFTWTKCAYRGTGGDKCAIGCLIKDESYEESFEGMAVNTRQVQHALRNSGVPIHDARMRLLLARLQTLHDRTGVKTWRDTLIDLAHVYDLTDKRGQIVRIAS